MERERQTDRQSKQATYPLLHENSEAHGAVVRYIKCNTMPTKMEDTDASEREIWEAS